MLGHVLGHVSGSFLLSVCSQWLVGGLLVLSAQFDWKNARGLLNRGYESLGVKLGHVGTSVGTFLLLGHNFFV